MYWRDIFLQALQLNQRTHFLKLAALSIACVCLLANCKPIARQEPVSDAKVLNSLLKSRRLDFLLKGVLGYLTAPILGAKRGVRAAVESLVTIKQPAKLMGTLSDVDWHMIGVRDAYTRSAKKSIKKLKITGADAEVVKQYWRRDYEIWSAEMVKKLQDSLDKNTLYRSSVASDTQARPGGGGMISQAKAIRNVAKEAIEAIMMPPDF